MPWFCTHLRYLALKTLTEGECSTWTGKLFQIDTPDYWKERLYNSDLGLGEYNCKGHVDLSILERTSDVKVKGVLKYTSKHTTVNCIVFDKKIWNPLITSITFGWSGAISNIIVLVYHLYVKEVKRVHFSSLFLDATKLLSFAVAIVFYLQDRWVPISTPDNPHSDASL